MRRASSYFQILSCGVSSLSCLLWLSGGTAFGQSLGPFWTGAQFPVSGSITGIKSNNCFVADFNGDGIADIGCEVNVQIPASSGSVATRQAPPPDTTLSCSSTATPPNSLCVNGLGKGVGPNPGYVNYIQMYAFIANTKNATSLNFSGFTNTVTNPVSAVNITQNPLYAAFSTEVPCLTGDFNGDGLADVLCGNGNILSPNASPPQMPWNYLMGQANTSSGAPASPAFTNTGAPQSPALVELNVGQLVNLANPGASGVPAGTIQITSVNRAMISAYCFVGNFFGTGLADVACLNPSTFQNKSASSTAASATPKYSNSWTIWRSSSLKVNQGLSMGYPVNGTTVTGYIVNGPAIDYRNTPANQCFATDINGDGITDLVCYDPLYNGDVSSSNSSITTSTWQVALGTGSGEYGGTVLSPLSLVNGPAAGTAFPTSTGNTVTVGTNCLMGDYNGDGAPDLACYYPSLGWTIYLSIGTRNNAAPSYTITTADGSLAPPTTGTPTSNCFAVDVNGDGKSDIVCGGYTNGSPNIPFQAMISTGQAPSSSNSGFVFAGMCAGNTCNNMPSPAAGTVTSSCQVGDFNGDGLPDIACLVNGTWEMGLSPGPIAATGPNVQPSKAKTKSTAKKISLNLGR